MIRVLIIDDEIPLLRNLSNFLSSFEGEFDVTTATTGEIGLELLRDQEFDVLLTDVRLPGIDGIDLLPPALEARPELRIIVMTAFSSADLRSQALSHGALRFLKKPLDLHRLRSVLTSVAEDGQGWSGVVGGLDIFDLTQLMHMTQKTRGLTVALDSEVGVLVFRRGNLVHAVCGDETGPEAFFRMARWRGGRFSEMSAEEAGAFTVNVDLPTAHLMMEAARRSDEDKRSRQEAGIAGNQPAGPFEEAGSNGKDGSQMNIKQHLDKLNGVEGFLGVGVFSPQGEMVEVTSNGQIDVANVGMYANNALLNSQKATDHMGVGRGNLLQIRAPKANIMMRCLNEATDFSATKAGKAHFHTVLVMEPEGNVAMGRMILDSVVESIAEEMR